MPDNIQIIGEAVSHLPDEVKEKETQVPWLLIKGMRNRLIHEYFGTDLSLVWDTIKNDLPILKTKLEKIQTELLITGK
ncbi:MAG: HepT-like ribonuclease domain-containing protein [Ginsengibacter sp.]